MSVGTKKRIVRVLCFATLLPVRALTGLVATIPGCYIAKGHVSGKYGPSEAVRQPNARAVALVAETQTEPHTCGMHTLRSAYRAYGLSPDDFDLRFRLGVDVAAVPGDKTSTGTLPPDMLRVIAQDGFGYEIARSAIYDGQAAEHANELRRLREHLNRGHVALMLVELPGGGLHWVGADRLAGGKFCIADSLGEMTGQRDSAALLADTLSIVKIRPSANGAAVTRAAAHSDGVREMRLIQQRMGDG